MVNTGTTKTIEMTLPSELGAQQAVHTRIVDQIRKVGSTSRDEFCIRLALEEALTNAIKHGNAMNPSKRVFVKSSVTEGLARIEIEDEGPGFVPDAVPDPTEDENLGRDSGRGVLLMRSFMDRIEYVDPGNIVVMEKQLGLK